MNVLKKILKILFVLIIVAAIVYVYYSVVDDIMELRELNEEHDAQAIKDYLSSFGIKGAAIIAAMEMLQMIVVFIPAEFVQISAGITYPYYYALAMCVVGIMLGASVIFLIVRVLNIKMEMLEKSTKKIADISKKLNKKTSMTVLMYLLFVMPAIPFGAICYFAATSKITYRRYIAVCATGVIPSITSSYVIGNIMYRNIGAGAGKFALSLAIVAVLMVVLLLMLAYVIKRLFMRDVPQKPNALLYYPFFAGFSIYYGLKNKTKNQAKELKKIKAPALVLCAHPSFSDFYYVAKSVYPKRINAVVNRYYTEVNPIATLIKPFRVIPKSLFTRDVQTVKKMLLGAQNDQIIVMMPEGRLSTSGKSFPIASGTAELIKKLGINVYKYETKGSYYSNPKWAKQSRRSRLIMTSEHLFTPEDLNKMSVSQISQTLSEKMSYDSAVVAPLISCADRTQGLDGILYKCPSCGAEYSLNAAKHTVCCDKCGYTVYMNESCLFENGKFKNIAEWYDYQSECLAGELDKITLSAKVAVSKIDKSCKKMKPCGSGECTLSCDGFVFKGKVNGENVEFTKPLDLLEALPFSANEEFELYHNSELYYFYPTENRKQCVKWSMFVDEYQKRRRQNAVLMSTATIAESETPNAINESETPNTTLESETPTA